MPIFRSRRLRAAGTAALIALTFAAPASAAECESQDTLKAFSAWGDAREYFLAPGGGFEGALTWESTGSPALHSESEPFALSGAGESSVRLRGAQTITSPVLCVGVEHPEMRFVARARDLTSRLAVELLWTDHGLQKVDVVEEQPADLHQLWAPSKLVPLGKQLPFQPGQVHEVRLRFKLKDGAGDWLVDDVFVDPYARR